MSGHIRRILVLGIAIATALTVGTGGAWAAGPRTYRVQLDAQPPVGEPWAFLRVFPQAITVHTGDVIDAAFDGTDTPHTATFVPSADADAWRQANQGPGGPYSPIVPDVNIPGDEGGLILNPAVAAPSAPACGASSDPCTFDGASVASSGIQFPNPGAQPAVFTKVTAPPGTYSFLCLLHEGMQMRLDVVSAATSIPSPSRVAARTRAQVARAIQNLAPVADAKAQQVTVAGIGLGHVKWTISAGGFYKGVSANEFVNAGVRLHVGDQLHVKGNFEIHTATFPASAAARVPFVVPECEGPNGDTRPPCADPSQLELAFNPTAVNPTTFNGLVNPTFFRNAGLLPDPTTGFTFVAKQPGTYSMVCLVHGPEMRTTITVEA